MVLECFRDAFGMIWGGHAFGLGCLCFLVEMDLGCFDVGMLLRYFQVGMLLGYFQVGTL